MCRQGCERKYILKPLATLEHQSFTQIPSVSCGYRGHFDYGQPAVQGTGDMLMFGQLAGLMLKNLAEKSVSSGSQIFPPDEMISSQSDNVKLNYCC